MSTQSPYDVVIIGGGVNGCGIARDAAGRGLSVLLCEKDDLAQATSSASTKLFHGGLRYLEYYEFRLVREALIEREVAARDAHFLANAFCSAASRGLRPSWLLRLGLFLYDHLGGRRSPRQSVGPQNTRNRPTTEEVICKDLDSDCWVEDSRLVVLNARDAEARGATIKTRTQVEGARRDNDLWTVKGHLSGDTHEIQTGA